MFALANVNLRNFATATVPELVRQRRSELIDKLVSGDRRRCDALRFISVATMEQALDSLRQVLGLPESVVKSSYDGGWRIEMGAGFSTDVTLYVKSDRIDFNDRDLQTLPNGDKMWFRPAGVVAEVSWSGTSRDMTDAAAAITLYQQAVQLGQLVESALKGMQFLSTDQWVDLEEKLEKTPEQVEAERVGLEIERKLAEQERAAEAAEAAARAAKREARKARREARLAQ